MVKNVYPFASYLCIGDPVLGCPWCLVLILHVCSMVYPLAKKIWFPVESQLTPCCDPNFIAIKRLPFDLTNVLDSDHCKIIALIHMSPSFSDQVGVYLCGVLRIYKEPCSVLKGLMPFYHLCSFECLTISDSTKVGSVTEGTKNTVWSCLLQIFTETIPLLWQWKSSERLLLFNLQSLLPGLQIFWAYQARICKTALLWSLISAGLNFGKCFVQPVPSFSLLQLLQVYIQEKKDLVFEHKHWSAIL